MLHRVLQKFLGTFHSLVCLLFLDMKCIQIYAATVHAWYATKINGGKELGLREGCIIQLIHTHRVTFQKIVFSDCKNRLIDRLYKILCIPL